MDHFRIPANMRYRDRTTGSFRQKPRPLHQRIEKFARQRKGYKEIEPLLKATKNVTNPASHGRRVTNDDLLNAFDLLEYILRHCFDNQHSRIKKIASMCKKPRRVLGQTVRDSLKAVAPDPTTK